MSDEKIPQAIAEAEMNLLGMKIKVHVLDNGQRVIEQADMMRVLGALAGYGDVEICEGCSKPLVTGDLVHRCADGPVLCDECAPTWADVLAQYADETDGDFGAFVDKSPEEMTEDRAAAQARVDAGEGDKKHVWPL